MNCKDIVWYYIEKSLNKKFFNSEVRELPIFLKPLRHDMLGDFRHTADGFNSIILADNAELKPIQMVGVLIHEMCHQLAFQKHGCEIPPHGKEWQDEMRSVGFKGKINRWTDGINFCSKELFDELLKEHNDYVSKYGISDTV